MKNTIKNRAELSKVIGELVSQLKESKISCDEFIHQTIWKFDELNPDQIYLMWSADDVQGLDKTLTKKESQEVIKTAGRRHDASIGINWDVLRAHIDYR